MMNENTRDVLMKRFEKIISKLSMQEYLKANTNKQGKFYKKHRSYSLTQEIQEVQKLYDILFFTNQFEEMTKDQEEEIKGYLLQNRGIWQDIIS